MAEILVETTRGEGVENRHWGNLVVADAQRLLFSVGEEDRLVFFRSAVKPFHTLAVVESGAAEAFSLTSEELAVLTSSHSGEEVHTATVGRVLEKCGLAETDLGCGTPLPLDRSTADALRRAGVDSRPLHCNCSGNHTGILAICRHWGYPVQSYLDPEHPVQRLLHETTAQMADYPAAKMVPAVDGCGLPVHGLPLRHLATAYARLADPTNRAAQTVLSACLQHPYLVGGRRRFVTALMEETQNILAKDGAEGILALAVPNKGWGIAVKIEDGNARAAEAATVELLRRLDLLSPAQTEALGAWHHPEVRNNLGERVGEMRAVSNLA